MQPKFASIKANVRNAPTPPPAPTPVAASTPSPALANPYASSGLPKDGTGFEGAPKDRHGRNFRFNPKGKYVAMANQLRQEQQLEALKQRIAESARKAGLDSDMGIEKNIKVFVVPRILCALITSFHSDHLRQRQSGGMQHCFQPRITRISKLLA
jgi:U4/U6 small nuclear ribonucleoprotein PRP3